MLTPLDIENKRFPTKFKGYDDAEVDAFLDQLTIDYEKLYKEINIQDKNFNKRIRLFGKNVYRDA